MDKILLIILITVHTNILFSQITDIRIYDGDMVKVDLSMINDSLAYISFEEFEGSEFLLGKYHFDNDTLFFEEMEDELTIKSEIYYSTRSDLDSTSRMFQTNPDHLFSCGKTTFKDLSYRINADEYPSTKDDPMHTVIIKELGDDDLTVEVLIRGGVVGKFDVKFEGGNNVVSFRIVQLFSTYSWVYDLDEILPDSINIDGIVYGLSVN